MELDFGMRERQLRSVPLTEVDAAFEEADLVDSEPPDTRRPDLRVVPELNQKDEEKDEFLPLDPEKLRQGMIKQRSISGGREKHTGGFPKGL